MKAQSAFWKIGCVVALLGALVLPARAASVTFLWNANTEADLAGYRLYIGPAAGTYTNHIALGRVTTHTLPNLENGAVYFFALSAVNSNDLESDLSVELRFPNLPPAIASIPDYTIVEDAPQQTVTLSGLSPGAGENQSLTITATSGNPSLIPHPTVNYTSGANGTLRFTPTLDNSGSALITVTVDDGQSQNNTAVETFTVTVTATNDAPTLGPIADQTTMEDVPVTIPLQVADVDTPAANLRYRSTSSNPALIPTNNISFPGAGVNRSAVITPVANQSGTATLVIVVGDGLLPASRTFTFTVIATNDLPVISQPPDLSIIRGTSPPPIPFTVDDAETPASSLGIICRSTNNVLQRGTNLVVSGTGNNRILTMIPTPGLTGTTRISINVNDGTVTNSVFFQFTITDTTNAAPVLTVPGALAGSAGAVIPISGLRVADPDAGANNLNFTLTAPNGALTVSTTITAGVRAAHVSGNNSGAVTIVAPLAVLNATLTNANGVSYASRTDFSGTETLVVSVNDNGHSGAGGPLSDTENIAIEITATTQNNLEVWRGRYFSAADLQDPAREATLWGDLADPDSDGRHNLMEFALGLNPLGSEAQETAFVSQTGNSGGNQYLTLTFNARINEPLIQYIPEVSADNATWSATTVRTAATPINAEFERVTHRDTVPITAETARFIRLRVVKNSP